MRIVKKVLNDALRVLGKVVCQTSPVELYRSIRFVGDVDGVMAMATDGVEVVSVILDAFAETEIDFCVPFKKLKDQVKIGRSETIELTGSFIEFPASEEPSADAMSAILPVNFGELLAQAAPIVDRTGYRRVLHGINLSNAGVTVTDGKQLLHLPCALSLAKDVTIPFPSDRKRQGQNVLDICQQGCYIRHCRHFVLRLIYTVSFQANARKPTK